MSDCQHASVYLASFVIRHQNSSLNVPLSACVVYVKLSERDDAAIISVADIIRSYQPLRPETSHLTVHVPFTTRVLHSAPLISPFSPLPDFAIVSKNAAW